MSDSNITISSHAIRITRTNTKDKNAFETLDRIGHAEKTDANLFTLIEEYLSKCTSDYQKVKGNHRKIWIVNSLKSLDGTTITGLIGTGEGGHKEDIVNLLTHKVDYQKQTNQAGLRKYFFLIYIPENSKVGYLILQRIQNHGIQGIFGDFLRKICAESLPRYGLQLNNIFSKEYFERIQSRWLPKEVRIVEKRTNKKSGDIADFNEQTDNRYEKTTTIEHILKNKYGGETSSIIQKLFALSIQGELISTELLQEVGIDGDFEKASIVVSEKSQVEGGRDRRRTINITDVDNLDNSLERILLPYRDITNDVVVGDDGEPTFDSIEKAAWIYLKELLDENK